MKKPELTADWENKLSKIAEGKLKDKIFLSEIRIYAQELTKEIKTGDGTFRHDNLTNTKCPVCGKRMLAVNGKTVNFWYVRTENVDIEKQFPVRRMQDVQNVIKRWNYM